MIPLAELLKNKTFERYFTTTPHLYPVQTDGRLVWRIWVRPTPKSPWRRKDVADYQAGVRTVLSWLERGASDAALQCRGRAYDPPTRLVKLVRNGEPVLRTGRDGVTAPVINKVVWSTPGDLQQAFGQHHWCYYCRRPTVFSYFQNHHAFQGTPLEAFTQADTRRCTLCGISFDHARRAI